MFASLKEEEKFQKLSGILRLVTLLLSKNCPLRMLGKSMFFNLKSISFISYRAKYFQNSAWTLTIKAELFRQNP